MSDLELTIDQFAERIGRSRKQVERYRDEGRIPGARKVGTRWFIPADAVVQDATSYDVAPRAAQALQAVQVAHAALESLPPIRFDVEPQTIRLDVVQAPAQVSGAAATLPQLLPLEVVAEQLGTTVGRVRRLADDGHLVVGPYGARGALRVVVPAR